MNIIITGMNLSFIICKIRSNFITFIFQITFN